jgi:hypothetical protein
MPARRRAGRPGLRPPHCDKVTRQKSEGKRATPCVMAITCVPYTSHRRAQPIVTFLVTPVHRTLACFLAILPLGCMGSERAAVPGADSGTSSSEARVALDTPRAAAVPVRAARTPRLTPAADSLASRLTFVARNTTVLTAATRGGRWLVDIGRVDASVRPERLAAYREAVAALSPVRRGDTLHLYGPWGVTHTAVDGFDVWSGRIVATIAVPAEAESLAVAADRRARAPRGVDTPFAAAAFRFPLARDPSVLPEPCARDSITPELAARADSVSDSLRTLLLADTASAAPQYRVAPRVVASRLAGCFGTGRVLVLVSLRSGGDLLTRERAALIAADGSLTPLRLNDFRFRAHALLHVLDADGDGIDDVVARGYGRRVGSLVVLKLDPAIPSLTRLTGGFAYEG